MGQTAMDVLLKRQRRPLCKGDKGAYNLKCLLWTEIISTSIP